MSWDFFSDIEKRALTTFIDILKQRTQDADLKKHAIDLLNQAGSFEYTRKRLKEYEDEARQEILRLGGNPGLTVYLDQLSISKETFSGTPDAQKQSRKPE